LTASHAKLRNVDHQPPEPIPTRKEPRIATKPRVNREIKTDKVRVISSKNEQLGVLLVPEALRLAEAEGLDLVEVAPTAVPPVCRIMDYGKYKYEQTKKQHAAKLHQRGTQLKEVKFRPFTSQHDVDYKLRHAIDFLAAGHKVKLTVMFRGRELAHQEAGRALLDRLKTALADVCTPDHPPRTEGRNMMTIVSPKAQTTGKRKTAAKPSKAAAAGTAKSSSTPAEAAAAAPVSTPGPASETAKDT
jgi:translation initiation factor IF-3